MDIQTVIVYLIFFACIVYAVRGFIKSLTKKKDTGCGCGCSGCSKAKKDGENSDSCPLNRK